MLDSMKTDFKAEGIFSMEKFFLFVFYKIKKFERQFLVYLQVPYLFYKLIKFQSLGEIISIFYSAVSLKKASILEKK